MHISLDSALGQQRRLNQVGETISSIAAPTAAYSLRSITGGDPKVVRVRRESDNDERDFTASDVSSGALVNFVNTQVTAPLDIQALTSTGRDGDFLIAKAAYSLRSLGTRQATVAATGDTVARADGKYVCQVRRNSDNSLKSFTADEITDGTLLSYVNESFASSLPLDIQGSAAAAYSLRNLSSSYSGNVVEVRRSSDNNTENFTADEITNGTLLAFVGTGGSDNGFVKTWYDQSGNSKHAVQATSANQPKIVSAGALEVDGQSKPAIKFTATDETFFVAGEATSGDFVTQPYTVIFKANAEKASAQQQIIDGDVTAQSFIAIEADGDIAILNSNTTGMPTDADLDSLDSDFVFTAIINGASTFAFFNNTTVFPTSSHTDPGSNNLRKNLTIGKHRENSSNYYDNQLSELIISDSNESDKRKAIEESIAGYYGVTLASYSHDGHVSKWYDQSVTTQAGDTATGNHAIQNTKSAQPKIVNNGSLVADGSVNALDFDGTDDFFSCSAFGVSGTTSRSIFTVLFRDTNSANNPYLGIGNGTTASNGDKWQLTPEPSVLVFGGNEKYVSSAPSAVELFTNIFVGTNVTDNSFFKNGSEVTPTSSSSKTVNTNETLTNIGKSGAGNDLFYNGRMAEFIIYNTNQTDNRTAIEANMGEHYSISGIPAFDNSVNGFVETWYDQSGNGNNAVQATASLQPKIVNAGSLIVDNEKPAIQLANLNGFAISDVGAGSSKFAFITHSVDSSDTSWSLLAKTGVADVIPIGQSSSSSAGVFGYTMNNLYRNGSSISSTTRNDIYSAYTSAGQSLTTIDFSGTAAVGTLFNRSSFVMEGKAQEVIIYDSDQDSNRTALETNINRHYSIF
tara:strand:- start:265 stop:2829 length:2565 start_codon:yes stop_codon:yes gene_type:complete